GLRVLQVCHTTRDGRVKIAPRAPGPGKTPRGHWASHGVRSEHGPPRHADPAETGLVARGAARELRVHAAGPDARVAIVAGRNPGHRRPYLDQCSAATRSRLRRQA